MNLIFICGSLEPGRDGVGDYTRRLSVELIKRGNKIGVIALQDKYIYKMFTGFDFDISVKMHVLRLPANMPLITRCNISREWINEFDPEWLSLQFVPFSFDHKGLPFRLGRILKKLGEGRRWHIMFHELWVGEEKGAVIKRRFLGLIQRSIVFAMLRNLHFDRIHTSIPIYSQILKSYKKKCEILPLFSNIPRIQSDSICIANLVPDYIMNGRTNYLIGTLFGSIYWQSWDLHSLLKKLSEQYKSKKIVIVSIGDVISSLDRWQNMQTLYPLIDFLILGKQSPIFISNWLSFYTDFGILSSPPELAGKSGSFMAFKEHGIPVFCREPSVRLRFPFCDNLDTFLTVVNPDIENIEIPVRFRPCSNFNETVNLFLQSLN